MRLLLALALAARLGAASDGLPERVEALAPRLAGAESAWKYARSQADLLESQIIPEAEAIKRLRRAGSQGWFSQWRLQRRLARLKGSLEELAALRAGLESARAELFVVLSAAQEELRASLEAELKARKPDRLRLRIWLDAKSEWDRKLEEIGVSEDRPFRLVGDPGQGLGELQAKDRRKALEARSIQLEAWAEMARQDRLLLRRLAAAGVLNPAEAGRGNLEMQSLIERINRLAADNEAALSKI